MKKHVEQRVKDIAKIFIETQCTVREAAKLFGVSKSTVHKDMTERLCLVDLGLYVQVSRILAKNKAECHLRGGEATRMKYLGLHSKK